LIGGRGAEALLAPTRIPKSLFLDLVVIQNVPEFQRSRIWLFVRRCDTDSGRLLLLIFLVIKQVIW